MDGRKGAGQRAGWKTVIWLLVGAGIWGGSMLPARAAEKIYTEETETVESAAVADTQELTGETEGNDLREKEEELLRELIERLSSGELDSDEKISQAIEEAEERLEITLTQERREKMIRMFKTLNGLPLDKDAMLSMAQGLYEQYEQQVSVPDMDEIIEEQVVEPIKEALWDTIKNAVGDFFRQMGEALRRFFSNIFG